MPLNIQTLQQERAHKTLTAKDLVEKAERENRPMTADEVAIFDRLTGEIDNLDQRIKAIQEHANRQEQLDKLLDGNGRISTPDAITKPEDKNKAVIPATPKRYSQLKAFKGADADEKAYRCGMWARATLLNDERAYNWCLRNGVGTDYRNALGTTPNTAGGVLIPEELSQTIIDLRETYGVFRRSCRVVPMGRDVMNVPRRSSGVTIAAIGENPSSAISQSQPAWNQVTLTAKKCGGLTLMSTEVAEDAIIDLADWIASEAAYAFALFEDQCGFIGTGTSTYLGIRGLTDILKAGQNLAGAVDAASAHDTFAEIDASDLASLMAKLPEYARMNAKWYCSTVCFDLVFGRLMAAAGGNTIQDMQGGYTRSYMGYPIVISQVLPTSTGDLSDAAMLLFGDLSKSSTLGDRRDMRVFPSEHRYMDTDQIGIRFTSRLDIVNHDYGDSTNAGPIVALVGE